MGPNTPCRTALVKALSGAVPLDALNVFLVAHGTPAIPSYDWLLTNDVEIPSGIDELPAQIVRPMMAATSLRYHQVAATAFREAELSVDSTHPTHLVGSADFAGVTLEPALLEGIEKYVDFWQSHEYVPYPGTAEERLEGYRSACGDLPYFVTEFCHVDDSQDRYGPKGYIHVPDAATKVDGYRRTVLAMSGKEAPGCMGISVHAELDHVWNDGPEGPKTDQWGYVTRVTGKLGETAYSQYAEYAAGLRAANEEARRG